MTGPRIAVFGAGLVGQRHVEQAVAQARLGAIVDPSDAAAELAKTLGVPHFAGPAECVGQLELDGVVIATPNHLHADHAVMCLEAGIPVLIEKPVADTMENADRIVAASRKTKVAALVGHHRRHNPIVQCAKDTIAQGALGDIVTVTGQFWLYKPDDYFQSAWRKGPGAGPTLINFVHDIDLLRHFCGEVVEIQAMRSNLQRGQGVEDTAAVLMRFDCGALGTFSISDTVVSPVSWEMTSGENPIYPHHSGACYTIGGTQASLSIPDLRLWQHDGPRSWWNPIHARDLSVVPADAFERQFAHFIDVIHGADPIVTAEDARDSLAVVLKVLEAELQGNDTP